MGAYSNRLPSRLKRGSALIPINPQTGTLEREIYRLQRGEGTSRHFVVVTRDEVTREALQTTLERLVLCRAAFESTDLPSRKFAAKGALLAAATMVSRLGLPSNLADVYMHLYAALEDLDYGIVDPIVSAAKVDRRPGDPSAVWAARVTLVVAVETFKKGFNCTLEAACEIALSKLEERLPEGVALGDIIPGSEPPTPKNLRSRVLEYRKQLAKKDKPAAGVSERLAMLREFVENISADRAEEFATEQIRRAASQFVTSVSI